MRRVKGGYAIAAEGVIAFRVDENLKRRADEVTCRTGRSKAWVIRKAVESYLDDVEDIEMSEQRLVDPNDNIISSNELMSRL